VLDIRYSQNAFNGKQKTKWLCRLDKTTVIISFQPTDASGSIKIFDGFI
jgi:hypothetical protein